MPTEQEDVQKIREAYAKLSDQEKEKLYDQLGKDAANQRGGQNSPSRNSGGELSNQEDV